MRRVAIIIIVLILLLAGAVAGVFFLAPDLIPGDLLQSSGPTGDEDLPTPTPDPGVDIVVARVDLELGTHITNTEQVLETDNIETPRYDEQAEELFRAEEIGSINGKMLTEQVFAGNPIRRSILTEPSLSLKMPTAEPNRPRPKAYPFRVDNFSGVANQIAEGDLVDVVATFVVRRRIYLPSQPNPTPPPPEVEITEEGEVVVEPTQTSPQVFAAAGESETREFFSTKTIVQRAKVLAILQPPVPTPTPLPEQDQPPDQPAQPAAPQPSKSQVGGKRNLLVGGQWQVVVLALTDQQAELIEFAQQSEATITLVLRGAGDAAQEETIGATFDLLLSEFGLPMPEPENPFIFSADVFTPQPTRTPAPARQP